MTVFIARVKDLKLFHPEDITPLSSNVFGMAETLFEQYRKGVRHEIP